MPGDWSTDPITSPAADGSCPDPGCATCKTMEAGARVMCALVGVQYDTLGGHAQSHYKAIVSEVYAAMSTSLLELGVAREVQPS